MNATIPGGSKRWLDVLPGIMPRNPDVIVVLVPDDARHCTAEDDGVKLALIEMPHTKQMLGIQVLSPVLGDWAEHVKTMALAGYRMAPPAYIGSALNVPQSVLNAAGMCPLFMLKKEMSRGFWNIKAWYTQNQGEESTWS